MNDINLTTALNSLPEFDTLHPEQLVTEIKKLIEKNKHDIDQLFATNETPSWEQTIRPLEDYADRLSKFWSPYSHLHNVADTPALRDAYNEALPLLSAYANEYSQDQRIYAAYVEIDRLNKKSKHLNPAQNKAVSNALRDFRLSGIGLKQADQDRLREINLSLTKLSTEFEEHVLDATQKWKKHITDPAVLAGLPESALALARQNATGESLEGYLFTLDYPCYMPVMTYLNERKLREEFYRAYVTRASTLGPNANEFDNTATIEKILELRHELATVLGFSNYAEYSLATKMAETPSEVISFLRDLAERSKAFAVEELKDLRAFAAEELAMDDLQAWDLSYVAEKLRLAKYAISQEDLRPYFPIDQVLKGLFKIVGQLFGIAIREIENPNTWHSDVRLFEVRDQLGDLRGLFYTDLYAREHKRGGAWMDDCVGRRKLDQHIQHPVAYLTCNFSPPVGDKPATLTHDEVITLFHEFGHGLHHMLTKIDVMAVAGINGVPWDGVELPSQFLENWCWEREALDFVSSHVDTGDSIPDELVSRMHLAKNFHAAMQMLRQIEFALFDFRLHAEFKAGLVVQSLLDEVRAEVSVTSPPEYNRFQNSFSHIFAGGYAAGYYSYKWAELLSADAFSKFEETGIFNADTGGEFLHSILERGGAKDMMSCFAEFRGREPDISPLLRHSGLVTETS